MSGTLSTRGARTSSTCTCGTCGRRSSGRSAPTRSRPSAAPGTGCAGTRGGAARMHLPIRLRLTLVFTLCMAVLLGVTGTFVYLRLGTELQRATDSALFTQANSVAAAIGQPGQGGQGPAFYESSAARTGDLWTFTQVLGPGGKVGEASTGFGRPAVPLS